MAGMRSVTRLFSLAALVAFLVTASPAPAAADLTAFIGISPSPASHGATGLAIGGGFLIVAFEFEYSHLGDDVEDRAPALTTASGNVLVQTPVPISGWQFYGTLGGGGYRERLEDRQETHVSTNLGGGAKYTVAGPFRLRFDYRIFSLLGSPIQSKVHRFYAGANLAF
jgi:hypothetical protein